ncbi:putative 2-succinyl-6-hydroxy-2,4-cyclohexadiene-1-carboxylate synthase [Alicyclobacillus acidoterrestris]|uniref:2-succinyl-6-hydroxy-2, 4-cyclohexadiene-1-carboxylate synthase n=1 Tax=Alicyclobacillus suci TaxID=2816080 RepID=UPI001190586E|nr:2-succinyl-6-hydroxy-2,4-cyclohexadiene-1-carboxylate synthase [Alicyclobacillus suci]GEO26945.1 putative 2-succinyl-6-hydroxy-2,4-cyclohexadiene-1-carboxylate synthase [Alicyclobacillus acidoterrestris]
MWTTRPVSIRGADYHVAEAGSGTPLLLLHGFTGSHEVFEPLLARLVPKFRCIAPDLLGHGTSAAPTDSARYHMDETLADLVALLDVFEVNCAHVLGYSMGGRIALSFAAKYPSRVKRLVLEGASPGLREAADRAARRSADEALAASILEHGVAAFVARWEEIPLFASQKNLPRAQFLRQREIRMAQRAEGLAGSLRGIGTGAQPQMWTHLSDVTAKTLLVTGQLDVKFTQIASEMARQIADCETAMIARAGHTPHLEQPEAFLDVVVPFLANP